VSPSASSTFVPEPAPAADSSMKIDMIFRIWTPASSDQRDQPTQSAPVQHPGILALIEDAAAARHGVVAATNGQVVASGFKEPADALVVSRQIQCAMQGFHRKVGPTPVALSIVLDFNGRASSHEATLPKASTERKEASLPPPEKDNHAQEVSHDLVTLLAIAKPAQILITHDLLQRMTAIKGLPLKSFPGRFGVYEYLWTAEEKLDLLQSEPQLTLAAVPSAPAAVRELKETKPSADQVSHTDAPAGASSKPVRETQSDERWPESGRRQQPLLIAGIAVAAVIVVGVIGFALFHGHSTRPANATAPASAPTSSPGATSVTPHTQADSPKEIAPEPAKIKPAASPLRSKSAKPRPAEQAPITVETKSPSPAAPSQPCTLSGDIGKYASLAESYRERGDYPDAIRNFRLVLNCDPSNAAARDGLNRALQAQQQNN